METIEIPVGDRRVAADVFTPLGATDARPAVLFLHGGAWRMGDRSQFHPQCERFAAAGYVAVTAQYALDSTILTCATDARAVFDHLVADAAALGIDADGIVIAGGSAGGHLAACLATCETVRPVRSPAAAVLFNPVLDLVTTVQSLGDLAPDIGTSAAALSPAHQPLDRVPPTIVFHGTADSLVPIGHSRGFRDAVIASGRRCDLVEFEGREHAFFNPVPAGSEDAINAGDFDATVEHALRFLASVDLVPA